MQLPVCINHFFRVAVNREQLRSLPISRLLARHNFRLARQSEEEKVPLLRGWISMAGRVAYFFNPAVKFVTTVTDWLTCCEIRSSMIFLPSGET